MTKKPSKPKAQEKAGKNPSVFAVLKDYKGMIALLVIFSIFSNAGTLAVPLLISRGIDAYGTGTFVTSTFALEFGLVAVFIFFFLGLASVVQIYASERVARDLRGKLAFKISQQSARFIERSNPSKLLTNITSDIDSIKQFVALAIVQLVSSAVIIIGAAITLLLIDWRLASVVLLVIPLIGGTFFIILGRVRALFLKSREVIDRLNKIISESIFGAALIRVLNSEKTESAKFSVANADARDIGINILKLFSFMIPAITFIANMAVLAVVVLGGYFVVTGGMSLGSFVAFNSYIAILIFPILVIGFMSNIITQAGVAYTRIAEILNAPDEIVGGTLTADLTGAITLKNISVQYGSKMALKDVSISIQPGTKVAIIGPTAAGKSQLISILAGIIVPTAGTISYDDVLLEKYDPKSFYAQVGLVFQDSVLFNTSIRENIAFSKTVTNEALDKAIRTAELSDFIQTLPEGLDTIVSERGTSLSGGQKQRIMLARALSINPKVLFLDDFTARVDTSTEAKILANIAHEYPSLTLVSVTQKIQSVAAYDQIIVLMEGEMLASGTHEELLHRSPEYVQIFDSQRSTNTYELQS